MTQKPVITIGMPVYNGMPYLRNAIESLLSQTLPNFQLLLSDNASDDDSWWVAQDFARRDSRIKCIRQSSNIGAAQNFHFLLKAAETEYFAWAGCHDLWSEGYFEQLVNRLIDAPACVLSYGATSVVDGLGDVVLSETPGSKPFDDENAVCRACDIVRDLAWCNLIYGVYRTKVLKQCRLMVPSIGPDHVLLMELALRGVIRLEPNARLFRREYRAAAVSEAEYHRGQLQRLLGKQDVECFLNRRYTDWWWQHIVSAWRVEGGILQRIRRVSDVSSAFIERWGMQIEDRRIPKFQAVVMRLFGS